MWSTFKMEKNQKRMGVFSSFMVIIGMMIGWGFYTLHNNQETATEIWGIKKKDAEISQFVVSILGTHGIEAALANMEVAEDQRMILHEFQVLPLLQELGYRDLEKEFEAHLKNWKNREKHAKEFAASENEEEKENVLSYFLRAEGNYANSFQSSMDELSHVLHSMEKTIMNGILFGISLLIITANIYGWMSNKQIDRLINFDGITGLFNRKRLVEILAGMLKEKTNCSILFIRVDDFPQAITNVLGRHASDLLQNKIANRIRRCLREDDVIARLVDNGFAVAIKDEGRSSIVATKTLESLGMVLKVKDESFFVSATVGIARSSTDGDSADDLLKNAEAAVTHVRDEGQGKFGFFNREEQEKVIKALKVAAVLKNVVEQKAFDEQFHLTYQPQINIQTGKMVGGEVLVRWKHSELDPIFPDVFIPVAEETGLIVPLGEWIFSAALKQGKKWLDGGYPPLRLGVNFSPRQLRDAAVIEMIQNALEEIGFPAEHLEIEVTETLMTGRERGKVLKTLFALEALGLKVSLDDFGTGAAGLGHLKDFPLHTLKIDRSYIKGTPEDRDACAIVENTIQMSHRFSRPLNVIAEGVEEVCQVEYLRKERCNEIQGYFYSWPVSAVEFENLLKRGDTWIKEKESVALSA